MPFSDDRTGRLEAMDIPFCNNADVFKAAEVSTATRLLIGPIHKMGITFMI